MAAAPCPSISPSAIWATGIAAACALAVVFVPGLTRFDDYRWFVGGGIGCTLLPGRIRGVLPRSVVLVPLQPRYQMRQKISVCFLRTRERDPNLLSLLAASRSHTAELEAAPR